MVNEKLMMELNDLEEKIRLTKSNIANKNFYPNSSPTAEQAAKEDLKMYEYRYKKMTMDLTDEDKQELLKIAEEKGWKLELLNKLKFTKAEKEDCKQTQSFFEEPLDDGLSKLLDEQKTDK